MPHQDAGTPPTPAVDKGALNEMEALEKKPLDELATPVESSYDESEDDANQHNPFSFSALLLKVKQEEILEKGHDTGPSVEV